ncbi:MAG: polyisoprenoid-binding protein [Nitrospiraceae bacterium]|nr:MAG: polyisoprenoid-binding protein [Nitrospiraceae bacterium]UCH45379.1 MAG: polyisoprenoid-binding protein [Nitrospiraceae bacterium]
MRKLILVLIASLLMYAVPSGAAVYELDPAHTAVGFSIEHMVISNVKGVFGSYEGSFELDETNKMTSAKAVIDVKSIDTKIEKRDNHLRSPDFFDVAKYPSMTFKATSVKHKSGQAFTLTGDLTIRGITKSVVLEGEIRGPIKDPWGMTRAGIIVEGMIKRRDFGLTWNKLLETGGLVVGETVTIQVEGEGILKK